MEDHGYCCVCVLCVYFVSIPFSYVLHVCVCVILFSSVTVCLCCVCVRIIFSMYMQIMGIRFCVCVEQVSKPPPVFNGEWLACYCFYGAVWTIVLYCVMFLSLQNIRRGEHWCVYCTCVKETSRIHNSQQQCSNDEVEFEIMEYSVFEVQLQPVK